MGGVIEVFTQGFCIEERYFLKMSLMETPMKILIVNSDEYIKYLSSDYRENAYVLVIDKRNCIPNKIKVKYYQFLNGFVENEIFGHLFDGVSYAIITLSDLGVCSDLLERSPEPLLLSFGLEDKNLDEDVLGEINNVGGIGVKPRNII